MSLPLAQDVLNFPGPHEIHNRIRKAVFTAFDLFWRLGDQLTYARIESLTGAEMAQAARNAGQKPPNSPATENAVRVMLRAMLSIRETSGMRPGTTSGPASLDDVMALLRQGGTVMVVQVASED